MFSKLAIVALVAIALAYSGCNKSAPAGAQTAVTGSSATKIAGYDDPNDALKAAYGFKAEAEVSAEKLNDALQKGDNETAKKHYYNTVEKYKNALKLFKEINDKFNPEHADTPIELFELREIDGALKDLQKSALPGW
jgi:predicted small secreted protein